MSGPAYTMRMLVLPTGQIMLTTGSSNRIWIFSPSDNPLPTGQPTISSVSQNIDGTFTLTGTQLNGISEGASYGDDAEMSSNYPIVRLTDTADTFFYARTFNWRQHGSGHGQYAGHNAIRASRWIAERSVLAGCGCQRNCVGGI